jgi:hypothetical protein
MFFFKGTIICSTKASSCLNKTKHKELLFSLNNGSIRMLKNITEAIIPDVQQTRSTLRNVRCERKSEIQILQQQII